MSWGENAVKVECETDSTKHPAKFYELKGFSLTIPELPSWSDSKGYCYRCGGGG